MRSGAVAMLALIGCRPPVGVGGDAEWSTGEGGSNGTASASEKAGGNSPSSASAGEPSAEPAARPGAGAGADSSAAREGDASCAGQSVTLEQIHSQRVREGVVVDPGPLVVTSQKFLVSEAKSGSCLWGALAASPMLSGAGSGLFLVSFGAPHAEGEACQPGADGLPDDLAPGDVVEASGKLDAYVPAACPKVAPMQQLVIDARCPLKRTGKRTGTSKMPEPSPIDFALADRLAAGTDAELMRQWGGALVQLTQVSARADEDGDAVFPFGVVHLTETELEVHSRLYYFDLNDGGPRSASKAPRYPYPTLFAKVSGVLLLDYCSWVLAPRSRCTDSAPASTGCTASAVRP